MNKQNNDIIEQLNELELRSLLKAEREHSLSTIRMLNEQVMVMNAMRQAYETMLIIDLRDYSFTLIQATPEVRYASTQVSTVLQLGGLFCKHFVESDYAAGFMEFVNECTISERLAGNRYVAYEYMTKNIGWCRARIIPAEMNSAGQIIKAVFTTETVDDHHAELSILRVVASRDALTGISNRFSGEKNVKEALLTPDAKIFAIMDCDSFKDINDNYGHPTGDKVLIEVAKALSDVFGRDNVMRLGGDEFAALITDPEAIGLALDEGIEAIFAPMHKRLEKIEIPQLKGKYPTLSCGAILVPSDKQCEWADIYVMADENLYKAKASHNGACIGTII